MPTVPAVPARLRPLASPLALAVLVVVGAAIATRYAVRIHLGQGDEFLSVIGARAVQDDLGALFDTGLFNRGPERLTALLLVPVDWVFSTGTAQMKVGHAVLALAFCLTAVPAALLVRGLGGTRGWQLAAGAVCVLSPWLVFASSFLNVTVAVPLTTLLFLAVFHAAVRPGIRADLLVLVAAAAAVLGRSGSLTMLAVPAVVLLAQSWRIGGSPLALARRHPLLTAIGAVFAVAVVVLGPRAFVGPAYTNAVGAVPSPDTVWDYTSLLFAELSMGTGYLPMAVALPWVVTQLVRPADERSGAFAWVAVSGFLVFVLTAAQAGAQTEERYIAVLVALPAVAFAAVLARREVRPVPTVAGAALVAWAVGTRGDSTGLSDFVAPARNFFNGVVQGKLSLILNITQDHTAAIAAVLLVLLIAAFVVAFARRPREAGAVAVVVVCVAGLGAGVRALDKWSGGNAAGTPWASLTWVDRGTGGALVALWNENVNADPARVFETEQIKFFNPGVRRYTDPPTQTAPDGALDTGGARYVLTWDSALPALVGGTERGRKAVFGTQALVLVDVGPDPATWVLLRGAPRDGWLRADDDAVLDVTDRGRAHGGCLRVPLEAPGKLRGVTRVRVGDAPLVKLRQGEKTSVTVPLRDDVRVEAHGDGRIYDLTRRASVLVGPFTAVPTGC